MILFIYFPCDAPEYFQVTLKDELFLLGKDFIQFYITWLNLDFAKENLFEKV